VARHGRVFEAGLAAVFALKSGRPLQDASLGLPMLTRGKLSLTPHEPEGHGKAEVAAIFSRFRRVAVQGSGPGSHGGARRTGTAEVAAVVEPSARFGRVAAHESRADAESADKTKEGA
jgi:hypothetical protein